MRTCLILVSLPLILAWKRIEPPEAVQLRHTCGYDNQDREFEWSVTVRNDNTEIECGGTFVTRTHVLTSPQCLVMHGAFADISQISVISSHLTETPIHYRFPSVFDQKFYGAEIAILEMAEGLVDTNPVCLPDYNNKLTEEQDLLIIRAPNIKYDVKLDRKMADCMKSEDAGDDECTSVFTAKSATFSHADFNQGEPVYKSINGRQYLVGMIRDKKHDDYEKLDFEEKQREILALSTMYWTQFICEHTGACLINYYSATERFNSYVEDGVLVGARKRECKTTNLGQIGDRLAATGQRISKTELAQIKNVCGRGEYQKHAYLARVFLGPWCYEPGCTKDIPDLVYKICDGVFISNIHVLTSSNCFRTLNVKQAYYEIRRYQFRDSAIFRAVGPICYEEPCFRDIICLPTKQMMREIANADTKLTTVAFVEEGAILKEEIDAKLKRINCSETFTSCSYFEVETAKSRSELSDGTPLLFAQDLDGIKARETKVAYFLAGLLVGRTSNTDNRTHATDALHILDRICLLTGVCMEQFDTLQELAVQEQFGTSERDDSALGAMVYYGNSNGFELFREFNENDRAEQSSNELWAELNRQTAVNYSPELRRLSKAENEDLQNSCGKGTPKPMINFGTNMTTSQFVVGIGLFLNFPMDYSYGPTCSGVIISNRHVLTADHCVDSVKYDPSRVYVSYGSNCFNPIFSRNNHTTYVNAESLVPCGNNTQRIAFVKHIITQKYQLRRADLPVPTHLVEREGEPRPKTRDSAAGDLAILELREDINFDSRTSSICMPRHNQEYQDDDLTIYGVGGETRTFERHREFSMEGLVTRLIYSNNTSGVRFGRDHDYWVESDDFEYGTQAIDWGDSGGPWTRKSSEERDVLVSISSTAGNSYMLGRARRYMISTGPALEYDGDFICKWTGVCPEGIDAARDKQDTNVDGAQYCGELPPAA